MGNQPKFCTKTHTKQLEKNNLHFFCSPWCGVDFRATSVSFIESHEAQFLVKHENASSPGIGSSLCSSNGNNFTSWCPCVLFKTTLNAERKRNQNRNWKIPIYFYPRARSKHGVREGYLEKNGLGNEVKLVTRFSQEKNECRRRATVEMQGTKPDMTQSVHRYNNRCHENVTSSSFKDVS